MVREMVRYYDKDKNMKLSKKGEYVVGKSEVYAQCRPPARNSSRDDANAHWQPPLAVPHLPDWWHRRAKLDFGANGLK